MAALDSNLIIDLEDGYRALPVMAVNARNINDLFEIRNAVFNKAKELKTFPYKYITIDNATRLEEMCLSYAAQLYRNTPMGANWGYLKNPDGSYKTDKNGLRIIDNTADVRLLPNGSGYLHLRNAVKKAIDMFKNLCETLILVAHVKDRQIQVDGEEMNEMAIDLAGKLSDIICGEADAIGYVSRQDNKTILTFKGGDNNIKGSRPLHLREKAFCVAESDEEGNLKIDMSQIFLDDKTKQTTLKVA